MANQVRNFIKGRMNKSVDERLVPNGEYIDAQNIRMGSTEDSEVGAVENTRGNTQLTTLVYPPTGTALSAQATCIGSYADGANETIYWFVHDPAFTEGATGRLDLIVSFNTRFEYLTYHVVSIDDGDGSNTTLNFDPQYLITGINLVDGLLFFTDNYNEPRYIRVGDNYPDPTAFLDYNLLEEDLLVIKKPPRFAPVLTSVDFSNNTNNESNYLEDKFLCFAYRYKYRDGSYSATSQFTAPVFRTSAFLFSPESLLNDGMENLINSCTFTFNSGGPLVVGFDILFKEMSNSVIKVAEKIDKYAAGIGNNNDFTYTFDNSRIYTILPESEILRLYDNVPLLAKAQTIMGNRLVYGNYVEGYDLIERIGVPLRRRFYAYQRRSDIGQVSYSIQAVNDVTYTIIPAVSAFPQTVLEITVDDPSSINEGDIIQIEFNTIQGSWYPNTPVPLTNTPPATITWTHTVSQGVFDLASLLSNAAFLQALGAYPGYSVTNPANYATADQSVLANAWNAIFPLTASTATTTFNLIGTGVDSISQPGAQIVDVTANSFKIALPMPVYDDGVTQHYELVPINQSGTSNFDPAVSNPTIESTSVGSSPSLHSNRNYEVGIVYMDEYGRSSTVVTSYNNTEVFIPCGDSSFKNSIEVNIPFWNPAPYWADRYKFVIKEDKSVYETIYSKIIYKNNADENYYLLLEGEQAAKIEKGDRLTLKADCDGPLTNCQFVTVLDKVALEEDKINGQSLAGTYMVFDSEQFNNSCDPNTESISVKKNISTSDNANPNNWNPRLTIPVGNTPIGTGSRITLTVENRRKGTGDGDNSCEARDYLIERFTWEADQDYADFYAWFYGQSTVESTLESYIGYTGDGGTFGTTVLPGGVAMPYGQTQGSVLFQATSSNELIVQGTNRCGGLSGGNRPNRRSSLTVELDVVFANDIIVFETEAQDTVPQIWYESATAYDIVLDPVTNRRNHQGNIQNQTSTQPAIVQTDFFNCYAFGNGVESFRIRDSIKEQYITLGSRVTTVSEQDYRQVRRFADLTYSGVYNDETNVNKLNEFNLGLLNFKPLEDIYGPVEKLFGRRTDILTLQEDKISYVLAGKNLLTDSTGESVVTSVPEILGTQVARSEDYGISNNPESFAEFGSHKFFTDAKRGVVVHLYGNDKGESLAVISAYGMRSWFRDMFIENFNTQKLGGYDPYMDEYVLASNDVELPREDELVPCGTNQTIELSAPGTSFNVALGATVGTVGVSYEVLYSGGSDSIILTTSYNGSIVQTPGINFGNQPSIPNVNKDSVSVQTLGIDIQFSGAEPFALNILVGCPDTTPLTIRLITLTNSSDSGKTIHNSYRWETPDFNSPLHTSHVKFISGSSLRVVSQYAEVTGVQGAGVIPTDDSDVYLISTRESSDTYIVKTSDRFRYLRSSTDYTSSDSDIAALLAAIDSQSPPTVIVPAGSPPQYTGSFDMADPNTGTGDYLYLVWDYSNIEPTTLCYDNRGFQNACCGCTCDPTNCQEYNLYNSGTGNITFSYTECGTANTLYYTLRSETSVNVCSDTYPSFEFGDEEYLDIRITDCDC